MVSPQKPNRRFFWERPCLLKQSNSLGFRIWKNGLFGRHPRRETQEHKMFWYLFCSFEKVFWFLKTRWRPKLEICCETSFMRSLPMRCIMVWNRTKKCIKFALLKCHLIASALTRRVVSDFGVKISCDCEHKKAIFSSSELFQLPPFLWPPIYNPSARRVKDFFGFCILCSTPFFSESFMVEDLKLLAKPNLAAKIPNPNIDWGLFPCSDCTHGCYVSCGAAIRSSFQHQRFSSFPCSQLCLARPSLRQFTKRLIQGCK